MARYLVRLANKDRYSPNDVGLVAAQIRKILGSKESASHFRIGTQAIEFNLFAGDEDELADKRNLLTRDSFSVFTVKLLDTLPATVDGEHTIKEGIELFNQERFWESHETLEQIWRLSKGSEKEALQSLILAAAAFVHYQKGETEISRSILKRARTKMDPNVHIGPFNLDEIRKKVDAILTSGHIQPFTIRMNHV